MSPCPSTPSHQQSAMKGRTNVKESVSHFYCVDEEFICCCFCNSTLARKRILLKRKTLESYVRQRVRCQACTNKQEQKNKTKASSKF